MRQGVLGRLGMKDRQNEITAKGDQDIIHADKADDAPGLPPDRLDAAEGQRRQQIDKEESDQKENQQTARQGDASQQIRQPDHQADMHQMGRGEGKTEFAAMAADPFPAGELGERIATIGKPEQQERPAGGYFQGQARGFLARARKAERRADASSSCSRTLMPAYVSHETTRG